jgi:hypothetical protein
VTRGCARSMQYSCHTGGMSETPEATPDDDAKERFRKALEDKKSRGGYGAQGSSADKSAAPGSSKKAGGKREFRRKSG